MLAGALYRPRLTPALACGRGDYLAAVAQSLGRDFGITRASTSVHRRWWFSGLSIAADSDEGRDMRRRIATEGGEMTTGEMEDMGIPIELRGVLRYFRRVQGAEPSLYRKVLDEITALEWIRIWSKASNGTAPGLSGLTHDMMAAVTYVGQGVLSTEAEATAAMSQASSLILRLVNVVGKSGYVCKQWRERAMRPIPKVPGDSSIDKVRPIT